MLRRLWNPRLVTTVLASFSLPLLFKQPSSTCWWWSEDEAEIKRNRIQNRVSLLSYPANTPDEDAIQCLQLTNVEGYAVGVYDGHGGNEVSEYLKENLITKIDQKLKENVTQVLSENPQDNQRLRVITSIKQAFKEVEEHILGIQQKEEGMFKPKQGSTALVALVIDNRLFVANLGDSQAVVVREKDENTMLMDVLNRRMNVNNPLYYNKLKAIFDQSKLFYKNEGRTYISSPQGKTQLTGSIGDLFIKKFQPQLSKVNPKDKPRKKKDDSSTFLIRSDPDITVRELKETDLCLMLASNGLWDQMKEEEVMQLFRTSAFESPYFLEELLASTISKISSQMQKQPSFLLSLPSELRPRVHDDISIVLLNLQHQIQPQLQLQLTE